MVFVESHKDELGLGTPGEAVVTAVKALIERAVEDVGAKSGPGDVWVTIEQCMDGDKCEVSVRDSGCGFKAPDDLVNGILDEMGVGANNSSVGSVSTTVSENLVTMGLHVIMMYAALHGELTHIMSRSIDSTILSRISIGFDITTGASLISDASVHSCEDYREIPPGTKVNMRLPWSAESNEQTHSDINELLVRAYCMPECSARFRLNFMGLMTNYPDPVLLAAPSHMITDVDYGANLDARLVKLQALSRPIPMPNLNLNPNSASRYRSVSMLHAIPEGHVRITATELVHELEPGSVPSALVNLKLCRAVNGVPMCDIGGEYDYHTCALWRAVAAVEWAKFGLRLVRHAEDGSYYLEVVLAVPSIAQEVRTLELWLAYRIQGHSPSPSQSQSQSQSKHQGQATTHVAPYVGLRKSGLCLPATTIKYVTKSITAVLLALQNDPASSLALKRLLLSPAQRARLNVHEVMWPLVAEAWATAILPTMTDVEYETIMHQRQSQSQSQSQSRSRGRSSSSMLPHGQVLHGADGGSEDEMEDDTKKAALVARLLTFIPPKMT